MGIEMRPARPSDVDEIASWTKETFTWGDYVAEYLPRWIADGESDVVVCVDDADRPIAVSHAEMLSAEEGWLSAARVHPDHRRAGLGAAMNRHGVAWAGSRGARIVRLVVEEDNAPAQAQVEKLGYRNTCAWLLGEAAVGNEPGPSERDRLRPSVGPDADAGWQLWLGSELALAGRELWASHWRWRKARRTDIEEQLREGLLLMGPTGWVAASVVDGELEVPWLATEPAGFPSLLQGILGFARGQGVGWAQVYVPETPWAGEALVREGFRARRMRIYAINP